MPYPYDSADLAAIDRLANFYNGGDYDASTNPGGMGRGGHRVNFENALADAARAGAANAAAAAAAGTSAGNAATSETNAAASAAKLIGSSTSSVAIGTGSKAFTTQAAKFFAVGTFVLIYSAANPTANYMAGQVTAYAGTDLTVNVTVTEGSGTFTDWVIAVAGSPGARGLQGLLGPVGPTPDIMVTFSDGVTDSDPGNGLLKFNNAAPASTTQLYIDNLDRYGTSIASWLDSFDDSTNTALRGTIKLVQVSDPTKYARFNVVGAVVDGTGYRKVSVAHVLSAGTFTNGAILAIDFVRTGNKGADGDGAGDVLGPATSTDNHVALFDGTTGKLLKGGGALAPVATSGLAANVSVTPTGSLGASSVQAALAELDDEKQPISATLTALAALTTTAFGRARLTDADAAAARAAHGLSWTTIYDQTVIGDPIYGFLIPLGNFSLYRFKLFIAPNPLADQFQVIWRTSSDGGLTYDAGSSDYNSSYLAQIAASVSGADFAPGVYGLASTNIAPLGTRNAIIDGIFERGANNVSYPRMGVISYQHTGTAAAIVILNSERTSGPAATHLLVATTVAAAFANGSSLIVEAR